MLRLPRRAVDSQAAAILRGQNFLESRRTRGLASRRSYSLQRLARAGAPRHAAFPRESRGPGCCRSRIGRQQGNAGLRQRSETLAGVAGSRTEEAQRKNLPERWKFSSGEFRSDRAGIVSKAGEARNSCARQKQRHRARARSHLHRNIIRNAAVAKDHPKGMESAGLKSRVTNEHPMPRKATIRRKTNETDIRLKLNLDGRGKARIATGIRFFDHMLELVARHGAFDLVLDARGDLDVDQHHTVEDVGIALGSAGQTPLGSKRRILRAGYFLMPMDQTLAAPAVDLGGRPYFVVNAKIAAKRVADFPVELVESFFQGFSQAA